MSNKQHFKTLQKQIYILNTHEIFGTKLQKIHKTSEYLSTSICNLNRINDYEIRSCKHDIVLA